MAAAEPATAAPPPAHAPAAAVAGGRYRLAQRILSLALAASLVLGAAAWFRKGELPGPAMLDPALARQPEQVDEPGARFQFNYRKVVYTVEPVAAYELWGLVVSHNDISSILDSYHDSDSVDTKDLCVIWGRNLESTDYRKVEYWSGSWTCNARWHEGVTFHFNQLSNNHMVTADPVLRERINSVRVGDQVHLRGRLVNYRDEARPDFWRRSSTTRDDSGNTACEVVFVSEFDILRRGNVGWNLAYKLGLWAAGLVLLAKLALAAVMGEGRMSRRVAR